jgi:transcriptional regulator with XRE-family HTH domain
MGKASRARPQRLAEKLTAIRKALGITHEDLIKKLDCPEISLYRASISQYESGKIEPPLPVLLRYARISNVYVEVLIDDAENLPAEIPAKTKRPVE